MKKLISAIASILLIFATAMPIAAETEAIIECNDYGCLLDSIASSENISIKLTGDIELEKTIYINSGKEVTIDLNGFCISLDANDENTGMYAFDNKGTLNLIDNTSEHKGSIKSRGIKNYNFFVAEKINMIACGNTGGAALWTYDNSTTNIFDCYIETQNGASGVRSDTKNTENTVINIENTKIDSIAHGVIASGSKTKVNISNSVIEAGGIALAANNGGVLETNNSEIIGNNTYGSKNFMAVKTEDSKSSIILNGGSINSYNGAGCIQAALGNIEATNVTAQVNLKGGYLATAFSASGGGVLTLNNCVSISKGYALYVFNSGAKIIVNGGEYQGDIKAIQVDDSTSEQIPSEIKINEGSFNGDVSIGTKSIDYFKVEEGLFTANIADYINENTTLLSLTSSNVVEYYAGETNVISEKVSSLAKEGDEIILLKGDANLSINLDNVTIKNQGQGDLEVNGEKITDETTTEHTHIYGMPTWDWSKDYAKATATFTCEKGDDTQVLEAKITSITLDPTTEKEGKITYTATVKFKEKEYSDTKEIIIDKLPEVKFPVIISGNNSTWNSNYKDGLTFTSNAEYKDFVKVLVDDKEVDAKYYTVKEGSTIVNLTSNYLKTLKEGKHTLSIVSTSGTATTNFTIETTSLPVPNTGVKTSTTLFIPATVAVLLGITAIISLKKIYSK